MSGSHQNQPPLISIVVPVMNEEGNVLSLAQEINKAMNREPRPWECIWIDDCSTDNTLEVLKDICNGYPQHHMLQMNRNSGQSAALMAGFQAAAGEFIATLDGDGQNDPADIPHLYCELVMQKVDMMNGIRAKRQDSTIRKISSRIGNGFRNFLTGEKVKDVGCAIRVVKRDALLHIPSWKGMHRFLPTLVRLQGYTIAESAVNHRMRQAGKTKYGINNRLWVGIADTFAVIWMKYRLVWPQSHPVASVSREKKSAEIKTAIKHSEKAAI